MAFLRESVGLEYFFNNVLNIGKHTTKDVEQSKILMKYSSNINQEKEPVYEVALK